MKTATSKKTPNSSCASDEMVTVNLDVRTSKALRKAAMTAAKVASALVTVTNGGEQ